MGEFFPRFLLSFSLVIFLEGVKGGVGKVERERERCADLMVCREQTNSKR